MNTGDVLARVADLAKHNQGLEVERWRIRQIMNGGPDGIRAIMAWEQGRQNSRRDADSLGVDLPAVNMMASGVERLAQKLGRPPSVKVPYGPRDSERAKTGAEKRERVVRSWDRMSRLNLQYPQIGRWLPGYGYYSWVIRHRTDPLTGQNWPHAELRDSFDTWPGYFGPEQQPYEVAYRRVVPIETLRRVYPERTDWDDIADGVRSYHGGISYGTSRDRSWEGERHGVAVIEYVCGDGYYICVPEAEAVIDYTPNPLLTGPPFVVGKRFSFDRMVSQYHHVLGLTAMMAKLNVLALIAAEDSIFRETNIVGDLEGSTYERGRFAVNFFTPGTRIERPTGDNTDQILHAIDRMERQLRIGAVYDQGSDSLAARGGFITGAGQRELRDPIEANINEYETVMKDAAETLDMRRLEWDERVDRQTKKRVFWIQGDRSAVETYVPAVDIGGSYVTERHFGVLSGLDDNAKIVAGLQLIQGGVFDVEELQDNLVGLTDPQKINLRMKRQRAVDMMMGALNNLAAQNDPRALMALTEIAADPGDELTILTKFFTPQEPEMSPEEASMAQMMGGGMGGPMMPPGSEIDAEGPPSVQTVLSRLTSSGYAEGGVQTVGTNVR